MGIMKVLRISLLIYCKPYNNIHGHQWGSFIAIISTVLRRRGTCLLWRRGTLDLVLTTKELTLQTNHEYHMHILYQDWHTEKISCDMTKPTKVSVHPAKTQISLSIRPVWSESSLSAWRKLGSSTTHWVQISRVFAGCTVIFWVLSCRGSNAVIIILKFEQGGITIE